MRGHCDICIIGAGASGMAAALRAKAERPELEILLIDKNAEPGRKLRATGNGRCNITNEAAEEAAKVLDFLHGLGIVTRCYPNGLIYPYAESAAAVAELLTARLRASGCRLLLETRVTNIAAPASGEPAGDFAVHCSRQQEDSVWLAGSVLIAAGGKAAPQFGTTGDGYRLASALGHSVRRLVPVLTAVNCREAAEAALGGIRARGSVRLYRQGEEVFRESGEIQFTRTGLSGICVFNMTRRMRFREGEHIEDFEIGLDLYEDGDPQAFLEQQRERARRREENGERPDTAAALLCTLLQKRLAAYVLRQAGVPDEQAAAALSDEQLRCLCARIHDLRFHPSGLRGWKDAQCTSGGVPIEEIEKESGASCCQPGLYLSGEVLDYDGPCGGYNLNHAWLSGIRAGAAMARRSR